MPCTFTHVQRLKPSSSQATGLGLSCLCAVSCERVLSTGMGSLSSTDTKETGRAPSPKLLALKGQGTDHEELPFCQGSSWGFHLWLHPTHVFLLHVDYNSVNNLWVAVLCMPCWTSPTLLGSAPENLKELYQTVTAYFKAAAATKVFLLALQLVRLYLKY